MYVSQLPLVSNLIQTLAGGGHDVDPDDWVPFCLLTERPIRYFPSAE